MIEKVKDQAMLMIFGTFIVLAAGVILARGYMIDKLEKKE